MGLLARSRFGPWKNFFIRQFIKIYGVNMADAAIENYDEFSCFNAFFTRALKNGLRPITNGGDNIACPADGTVSECGDIAKDRLVQAKGKHYSLTDLLGGDPARSRPFAEGSFATVYLSPKDYHRLHMPMDGKLVEMVHIPGRLFSVDQATANTVENLFGRNERVVAIFETSAGPMALVLVGALFVASIETVWHGVVSPPAGSVTQEWKYDDQSIRLPKGSEMGRFSMGSTIIVILGNKNIEWLNSLKAGENVTMGQNIGHVKGLLVP